MSRDAAAAPPALAHIAIVVHDLEAQAALPVQVLGLRVHRRTTVPGEGVAVSFVPVGKAEIELVQPLQPDGPLAKFLRSRGEAVHHLALSVPDLTSAITRAEAAGLRFAGAVPRPGAHGTQVAFLHPAGLNGLLVELVEGG